MFDNYLTRDTLQSNLTKAFVWMAIGLMVTGITSFVCYASGFFYYMVYTKPLLAWILILLQFVLVIGFQASIYKWSVGASKALFILYAITLGISLTSVLIAYSFDRVSLAFIISAVYFGCLAFIGKTTKRDLSSIGTLCMIGLFVMVISQLVLSLFHVSMSTRLYSIIGLLLFTGITAWDMQRMNHLLIGSDGQPVLQEKLAIYVAFELYLDFINIFLYILRLLGNKRD